MQKNKELLWLSHRIFSPLSSASARAGHAGPTGRARDRDNQRQRQELLVSLANPCVVQNQI